MTAYVQVTVRMTAEELERFDAAVAAANEGSRNATIRRVLVEWADRNAPKEPQGGDSRREAKK